MATYLSHVIKLTVLKLLSNGRVKLHKIFTLRVKFHLKICQGQICTFWYTSRVDLHINAINFFIILQNFIIYIGLLSSTIFNRIQIMDFEVGSSSIVARSDECRRRCC